MKRAIFFLALALALQAQEGPSSGNAKVSTEVRGSPSCDATDWKARAENLEQQIAALNEQMTAMGSFFTAKDKFTAIKAQEPPKPHPAQPDKP